MNKIYPEIGDLLEFDFLLYYISLDQERRPGLTRFRAEDIRLETIDLSNFVDLLNRKEELLPPKHRNPPPDRVSVREVILKCSTTNWVLPYFQRYFDWKKQDISDFLRSVFNNYYTGAFLLWYAGREPQVKVQAIKGVTKTEDQYKKDSVILDGQQRITSLYYAIAAPNDHEFLDKSKWKDTRIYREHPLFFYINLALFLENPKSTDLIEDYHQQISTEDCFKSLLFPLYELEKYDEWVSNLEKYLRKYHNDYDTIFDICDTIRKKLSYMWQTYEFPYILLPKDMEIDHVTEIFEQLNTKGKPLSVFDLLIARLYKFDIRLKDLWDNTVKKYPKVFRYSKNIHRIPIYILQAMLLYYDENSSANRSDILDIYEKIYQDPEHPEYIFEDHWNEFAAYLNRAIEMLENKRDGFGVKDQKSIPFAPMIPVLAAILKLVDTRKDRAKCYRKIEKWYWLSVFSNAYSKAANSRMTSDFKAIRKWFDDETETPKTILTMMKDVSRLNFIEVQSKSDSRYRGFLSIIALEGAKDFETGKTLENAMENDVDHIFPKSGANKSGFGPSKHINSALNITWMSKRTNREIKRAKKPSLYFQKLISERFEGKKEELMEVLETHLINKEALEHLLNDRFDSFLQERQKAVLSKIFERLQIKEHKFRGGLITPETPYSNKQIFWNVIRSCKDFIYWVDKYFSNSGLELLIESLDPQMIKDVKILMSKEKASKRFRKLFKAFKDELERKKVRCELRVIIDSDLKSKIHDRWIISKNKCYNVTSPDVMARGQYSEIFGTENRPPFEEWWKGARDIIEEWNEIEKTFKE